MVLTQRIGALPKEETCVYPGGRLACPGPERSLDEPFVAVLGAKETVSPPGHSSVPDALEVRLGLPCVDFSASQAGPDAYLADTGLMMHVQRASAVVITVPGAHALRNPFFTVHKWSNDRVIGQSEKLRDLFPEMEFLSYGFVRQMLGDMQACSPGRFAMVRQALQHIWMERMQTLLAQFDQPVIALWRGNRGPDDADPNRLDTDPALVTKEMFEALDVERRVVVPGARKTFLAGRPKAGRSCPVEDRLAPVVAELAEWPLGPAKDPEGPRRRGALFGT